MGGSSSSAKTKQATVPDYTNNPVTLATNVPTVNANLSPVQLYWDGNQLMIPGYNAPMPNQQPIASNAQLQQVQQAQPLGMIGAGPQANKDAVTRRYGKGMTAAQSQAANNAVDWAAWVKQAQQMKGANKA